MLRPKADLLVPDARVCDRASEHRPAPPAPAPLVPWGSITVRAGVRGSSVGREITGGQRLALLYAWYRDGQPPRLASAEVMFWPTRGAPFASPQAVDWSGFPWAEAVTAALAGRISTPLGVRAKR